MMSKNRNRENRKKELQILAPCLYCVVVVLVGTVFFIHNSVGAHEPTPQYQQPSEPSATSILDSTTPNSRIGGHRYDGSLKPTPKNDSRFLNNAKYGSAGNIVGVDHNSTMSRFQGGNIGRFQSKMDFNILALQKEAQRIRANQNSQSSSEREVYNSGAPRMVTARAPERIPYASDRRPFYGKYPDQLLSRQNTNADVLSESGSIDEQTAPFGGEAYASSPQLLWMRGGVPQALLTEPRRHEALDYNASSTTNPAFQWDLNEDEYVQSGGSNSPLGGSMEPSSIPTNAMIPAPITPTPEQLQKAFREYLEAQLLRSPDVNPLSPVQVSYQNGVVTVRGVVPTPSARAAAGYILLSDPRVSKVNNLMTCAHDDVLNNGITQSTPSQTVSNSNGVSVDSSPK